LPKNNNQEPRGEDRVTELEGLIAEKDQALAARDLRITELEQAIAERDNQIAALKQSVTEMGEKLAQAVASYRALAVRSNPGLPEEAIVGESIEEIDTSLAGAQALVDRVRQELEAEIAAARIPAGAPQRKPLDLSALSPKEKIQYAIGERR
jgi:uncharacterized coiled-coil protein SlyX